MKHCRLRFFDMSIESRLKRLEKIAIYKLFGSNIWHKRLQCRHYKNYGTKLKFHSCIDIKKLMLNSLPKEQLEYVAECYCKHRFDYLGSGWVNVSYHNPVIGVEGFRYHAKQAGRLEYEADLHKVLEGKTGHRDKLRDQIAKDYDYICWNRDYKSGYQWDTAYLDEKEALKIPRGADIKTVWELGRMGFVIQLALAALAFPQKKRKYIVEFKNITLDFILNNPVGVGVNWILPMEASIRSVNLLLAYDILCQIDRDDILNRPFREAFLQAVYEHGQFIYDNPESSIYNKNGNHYYSNIIGLLYIGAYLKGFHKADKWFRYGMQEYLRETEKQFFPDGGNIEASTSYHRLMTEMAIFGAAMILRQGRTVPEGIWCRLFRAAAFTKAFTKASGDMIQIGDNDSGRLINTVLYGQMMTNWEAEMKYENLKGYCKIYGEKEEYFDENILNHKSLLEYHKGLYDGGSASFESSMVRAIAQNQLKAVSVKKEVQEEIENGEIPVLPVCKEMQFSYDAGQSEIIWGYYSSFGLYYYKEGNMEFYMYTGGAQGRIRQGHTHNDIMHCELSIGGQDILTDKGTYLYINSDTRTKLRGRLGHFVPDYGVEPRKIVSSFGYEGLEKITILKIKKGEAAICYEAGNIFHCRQVTIGGGRITITDRGKSEFRIGNDDNQWYSNGYGKLQRRKDI